MGKMITFGTRALRGLAGLIVVFGAIGIGVATAPGTASATAAPAHEYNMCQDRCHRNPNDPDYRSYQPQDKVLWFVNGSSPAPWYVGLTEACATPVAYIAFHMPSSMQAHFYSHISGQTSECDNGDFGAASLEFGSTIGTSVLVLAHSADLNCIVKQGWGFQWRGCVAHLTSSSDTLASEDMATIYDFWNNHSGFIILAGDLNLDNPFPFPLNWDIDWSLLRKTAIMNPTGDTGLDEKIDWVFLRPSFFSAARTAGTNCDTYYTDHCYLYGTGTAP